MREAVIPGRFEDGARNDGENQIAGIPAAAVKNASLGR
jgi:hypothetical protein